jgi:hypothetical protein
MLKKAGIVVAVAAAGVVALTPLAFATGPDELGPSGPSPVEVDRTHVERDNQRVECDFENSQAEVAAGGAIGLNVSIPVNATIPIASCNDVNVEDVVDAGTNNPNVEQASTR